MSTTPRTDAELEKRGQVDEYLCRDLELALGIANATISELRKELAEVTAAFQAECDHTFETEDHSFSHEFGTERIFVCRCTKCGKDAEPGDMPDPGEDGCDDGPRDAREEARLDP